MTSREGMTAMTTATTSTTSNKQGWKTTQGLRCVKVCCQSCPLMRRLKRLQSVVISWYSEHVFANADERFRNIASIPTSASDCNGRG
jgi:hypothetical protein